MLCQNGQWSLLIMCFSTLPKMRAIFGCILGNASTLGSLNLLWLTQRSRTNTAQRKKRLLFSCWFSSPINFPPICVPALERFSYTFLHLQWTYRSYSPSQTAIHKCFSLIQQLIEFYCLLCRTNWILFLSILRFLDRQVEKSPEGHAFWIEGF